MYNTLENTDGTSIDFAVNMRRGFCVPVIDGVCRGDNVAPDLLHVIPSTPASCPSKADGKN